MNKLFLCLLTIIFVSSCTKNNTCSIYQKKRLPYHKYCKKNYDNNFNPKKAEGGPVKKR